MAHITIDGRSVEIRRHFLSLRDVADVFDEPVEDIQALVEAGRLTDVSLHGTDARLDPDEVARYAEDEVAARRKQEDVYARLAMLISRGSAGRTSDPDGGAPT